MCVYHQLHSSWLHRGASRPPILFGVSNYQYEVIHISWRWGRGVLRIGLITSWIQIRHPCLALVLYFRLSAHTKYKFIIKNNNISLYKHLLSFSLCQTRLLSISIELSSIFHTYIHTHTYVYIYIHTHTHMYTYTHTRIHTVYTHTLHTYTHTYTYIHYVLPS